MWKTGWPFRPECGVRVERRVVAPAPIDGWHGPTGGKIREGGKTRAAVTEAGFTLTELMVAIAIVAILGMYAVPNFQGLMVRSTIRSLSADLGGDIGFARSEAIRLGSAVSVCPAANADGTACATGKDWKDGWIVFRESSSTLNGTLDAGEKILRQHGPLSGSDYKIVRTDAGNGALTFVGGGSSRTGAASSLLISHPGASSRRLSISVIGRLTTTVEN